MKYLLTLLVLIPTLSFGQIIVNNQSSKDVENFMEQGLKQLDIDRVHVTIMDLTPELYKKFGNPSHELNAVTLQRSKDQYVILIGEATKTSLTTLVAHEIIHVHQRYQGNRVNEREAYSDQVILAQKIRKSIK